MLLPASLCSFKSWTLLWRDFVLGKPIVLGTFDFEGLSNISIASGALFCLSPETWRPHILMVFHGTIQNPQTEEDPTPTGKQEDSNTLQAPEFCFGQNMQILPVIILSTYINYTWPVNDQHNGCSVSVVGVIASPTSKWIRSTERFFPISISTKETLEKKTGTPLLYTILLRMVMKPKCFAFRRWLNIPITIGEYDWMPREIQNIFYNNHIWDSHHYSPPTYGYWTGDTTVRHLKPTNCVWWQRLNNK